MNLLQLSGSGIPDEWVTWRLETNWYVVIVRDHTDKRTHSPNLGGKTYWEDLLGIPVHGLILGGCLLVIPG